MNICIKKGDKVSILQVSDTMTLAQLLYQIYDQCPAWGKLEGFLIAGRDNQMLGPADLGKTLAQLDIRAEDTIEVTEPYMLGNFFSPTILLHYVTHPENADIAVAQKFFDSSGFNKDECGNTVSHFQARLGGDIKPSKDQVNIQNTGFFRTLIKGDNKCGFKNTPLHLCVFYGHSIDPWLAAGANVNIRNSHEDTPLHMAVANGHAENVAKLLAARAEVNVKNDRKHTPLHNACYLENNLEEIIDLLLKNDADINDVTDGNQTALMILLERNEAHPDQAKIAGLMRKFIYKQAHLNVQDDGGFTALFYARNNLLYLSILLEAGADPNIKARGTLWFNLTPATDAPLAYTQSKEAAEYLVRHGAEVPDSSRYLAMPPLKEMYAQSFIGPIFSEILLVQLLEYLPRVLLGIIQEYVTLEKEDQQQVVSMAIQRRKALLDPLLTQAEKKSGVLVGALFSQLFLTPLIEQIPKELLTIIQEYTLENEDQLKIISSAKQKEILASDVQDWRAIGQYFYNLLMGSQKFLERDIKGYWDKKVVSVLDNVLADTIPAVTLDIMRDFIVAKLKEHQSTFALNPDIINELMESKKGLSEKEKVLNYQHWLTTHWDPIKGRELCKILQKQIKSQPSNRAERIQIGLAQELYQFLRSYAPFTLGMDSKSQDIKENTHATAIQSSFFPGITPLPSNQPANDDPRLVVKIKKELWALAKVLKKNKDVVLSIPKLSNMQEITDFYESEKFHDALTEMQKKMDSTPQEARVLEFDLIQDKLKQGFVCVNKMKKMIECQHDLEGKKFTI